MKNTSIKNIALVGLGISINVVGAFIALSLKLPIYLDSIGTILIAAILGPKYAVISGFLGSIVSGMTFDIYSLYFAPVQISTGLLAGIMFKKGMLEGKKTPIGTFIFVLPTSIISAMVAAVVFGGVTSSGSAYIVQVLEVLSVGNLFSNIFLTQIVTDYIDKLLGVILVNLAMNVMPKSLKTSFSISK
ncbi:MULTISPECIES: ECF transporter S component [unclassified Romboutsia]|uniref:ECF transporter S component n=1 Tax=unclassified Romboutsia TaxID=2626894 RepID=UPI00082148DD|nr:MULTISPECIES: ECF transporter S component [unclassified Romboutsia]SCI16670.1 Predicted membrane protein [uncultured Clostridium sp.]